MRCKVYKEIKQPNLWKQDLHIAIECLSITLVKRKTRCDIPEGLGQINCPVSFRLVGGGRPNEGRYEVNYDGQWGTVCGRGDYFKETSALVACRELGYMCVINQSINQSNNQLIYQLIN
jgi:hypothetical protein